MDLIVIDAAPMKVITLAKKAKTVKTKTVKVQNVESVEVESAKVKIKFSSMHTVMDLVMFTFRMKVYGVKCLDINSEFKFESGQSLVQAKNSIQDLGSSTNGFFQGRFRAKSVGWREKF